MRAKIFVALLLFMTTDFALGHGRLMNPPSRSSMWRFPDDPAISTYLDIIASNYNDNELFCGGFQHQQDLGGKCGVCGDPYDGARENEAGGKYAKGIIVRHYDQGAMINVSIEITAYHKGYFEFRLCPWNNVTKPITHDCLNQHLLLNENGTNKYYPNPPTDGTSRWYNIGIALPGNVTCSQCVLQWRYHTGNSWGCDEDGTCCIGCGAQEEFYGCADVSIGTSAIPTSTEGTMTTSKMTTSTQISRTTTSKTSTTQATSTTTTETTTTDGQATDPCEGQLGNVQKDCTSFYLCNGGSNDVTMDCPPGTVFNAEIAACDYAYNTPPPCGTKDT